MPIVTLKNTHIESLSGKMILNCPASFGLVKLGFLHTRLNLLARRQNIFEY